MLSRSFETFLCFLILFMIPSRAMPKDEPGFGEGRAKVLVDGKWGYIDTRGKLVVTPRYDYAEKFHGGYARVRIGTQTLLLDVWGKPTLTRPQLPSQPTTSPLSKFSQKTKEGKLKWGFQDNLGSVVIKPKFDEVHDFHEGLAAVGIGPYHQNRKYGFINTLGQFMIKPEFDYAVGFKEGFGKVIKHGRHFFINKSGKAVFDATYRYAHPFHEGLSCVNISDKRERGKNTLAHGLWGYIDKQGRLAIPAVFQQAKSFLNGIAEVMYKNRWGLINRSGNFLISPEYINIKRNAGGILKVMDRESGKYGFIDSRGMKISKVKFAAARNFQNGMCAVKEEFDKKWGYINLLGEWAIMPRFDKAWSFSEGFAAVHVKGRLCYIDRKGEYIWRVEDKP